MPLTIRKMEELSSYSVKLSSVALQWNQLTQSMESVCTLTRLTESVGLKPILMFSKQV